VVDVAVIDLGVVLAVADFLGVVFVEDFLGVVVVAVFLGVAVVFGTSAALSSVVVVAVAVEAMEAGEVTVGADSNPRVLLTRFPKDANQVVKAAVMEPTAESFVSTVRAFLRGGNMVVT
jgi:hypothetical protein